MNKVLKTFGFIVSIMVLVFSYESSLAISITQLGSMFLFYLVGIMFSPMVVDYTDSRFDSIWKIEHPAEKFFYYAFPILAFGKKILTKKY